MPRARKSQKTSKTTKSYLAVSENPSIQAGQEHSLVACGVYQKVSRVIPNGSKTSKRGKRIVQQAEEEDESFEDPEFLPNPATLDALCLENSNKVKSMTWFRLEEFFKFTSFSVFEEIRLRGQVMRNKQYSFVVDALNVLSTQPGLVYRLFGSTERSQNGVYRVWLNLNGVWKQIIMDDYLPIFSDFQGKTQFFFTTPNPAQKEIWYCLLEKALAKAYGGYEKLAYLQNEKNLMMDFTGAPSKTHTIDCAEQSVVGIASLKGSGSSQGDAESPQNHKNQQNANFQNFEKNRKISGCRFTTDTSTYPKESIWEKLTKNLKKGYPISVKPRAIIEGENQGISQNHNFAVISAKEVTNSQADSTKIVKLRNPWINEFWQGDWSFNSKNWTNQLKRELKYTPQTKGHGEFWLSIEDFTKYFSSLTVYKTIPGFVYSSLDLKLNNERVYDRFFVRVSVKTPGKYTFSVNQHTILNKGLIYSPVSITLGKIHQGCVEPIAHIASLDERNTFIRQKLDKGEYYLLIEKQNYYENNLVDSLNNLILASYGPRSCGFRLVEGEQEVLQDLRLGSQMAKISFYDVMTYFHWKSYAMNTRGALTLMSEIKVEFQDKSWHHLFLHCIDIPQVIIYVFKNDNEFDIELDTKILEVKDKAILGPLGMVGFEQKFRIPAKSLDIFVLRRQNVLKTAENSTVTTYKLYDSTEQECIRIISLKGKKFKKSKRQIFELVDEIQGKIVEDLEKGRTKRVRVRIERDRKLKKEVGLFDLENQVRRVRTRKENERLTLKDSMKDYSVEIRTGSFSDASEINIRSSLRSFSRSRSNSRSLNSSAGSSLTTGNLSTSSLSNFEELLDDSENIVDIIRDLIADAVVPPSSHIINQLKKRANLNIFSLSTKELKVLIKHFGVEEFIKEYQVDDFSLESLRNYLRAQSQLDELKISNIELIDVEASKVSSQGDSKLRTRSQDPHKDQLKGSEVSPNQKKKSNQNSADDPADEPPNLPRKARPPRRERRMCRRITIDTSMQDEMSNQIAAHLNNKTNNTTKTAQNTKNRSSRNSKSNNSSFNTSQIYHSQHVTGGAGGGTGQRMDTSHLNPSTSSHNNNNNEDMQTISDFPISSTINTSSIDEPSDRSAVFRNNFIVFDNGTFEEGHQPPVFPLEYPQNPNQASFEHNKQDLSENEIFRQTSISGFGPCMDSSLAVFGESYGVSQRGFVPLIPEMKTLNYNTSVIPEEESGMYTNSKDDPEYQSNLTGVSCLAEERKMGRNSCQSLNAGKVSLGGSEGGKALIGLKGAHNHSSEHLETPSFKVDAAYKRVAVSGQNRGVSSMDDGLRVFSGGKDDDGGPQTERLRRVINKFCLPPTEIFNQKLKKLRSKVEAKKLEERRKSQEKAQMIQELEKKSKHHQNLNQRQNELCDPGEALEGSQVLDPISKPVIDSEDGHICSEKTQKGLGTDRTLDSLTRPSLNKSKENPHMKPPPAQPSNTKSTKDDQGDALEPPSSSRQQRKGNFFKSSYKDKNKRTVNSLQNRPKKQKSGGSKKQAKKIHANSSNTIANGSKQNQDSGGKDKSTKRLLSQTQINNSLSQINCSGDLLISTEEANHAPASQHASNLTQSHHQGQGHSSNNEQPQIVPNIYQSNCSKLESIALNNLRLTLPGTSMDTSTSRARSHKNSTQRTQPSPKTVTQEQLSTTSTTQNKRATLELDIQLQIQKKLDEIKNLQNLLLSVATAKGGDSSSRGALNSSKESQSNIHTVLLTNTSRGSSYFQIETRGTLETEGKEDKSSASFASQTLEEIEISDNDKDTVGLISIHEGESKDTTTPGVLDGDLNTLTVTVSNSISLTSPKEGGICGEQIFVQVQGDPGSGRARGGQGAWSGRKKQARAVSSGCVDGGSREAMIKEDEIEVGEIEAFKESLVNPNPPSADGDSEEVEEVKENLRRVSVRRESELVKSDLNNDPIEVYSESTSLEMGVASGENSQPKQPSLIKMIVQQRQQELRQQAESARGVNEISVSQIVQENNKRRIFEKKKKTDTVVIAEVLEQSRVKKDERDTLKNRLLGKLRQKKSKSTTKSHSSRNRGEVSLRHSKQLKRTEIGNLSYFQYKEPGSRSRNKAKRAKKEKNLNKAKKLIKNRQTQKGSNSSASTNKRASSRKASARATQFSVGKDSKVSSYSERIRKLTNKAAARASYAGMASGHNQGVRGSKRGPGAGFGARKSFNYKRGSAGGYSIVAGVETSGRTSELESNQQTQSNSSRSRSGTENDRNSKIVENSNFGISGHEVSTHLVSGSQLVGDSVTINTSCLRNNDFEKETHMESVNSKLVAESSGSSDQDFKEKVSIQTQHLVQKINNRMSLGPDINQKIDLSIFREKASLCDPPQKKKRSSRMRQSSFLAKIRKSNHGKLQKFSSSRVGIGGLGRDYKDTKRKTLKDIGQLASKRHNSRPREGRGGSRPKTSENSMTRERGSLRAQMDIQTGQGQPKNPYKSSRNRHNSSGLQICTKSTRSQNTQKMEQGLKQGEWMNCKTTKTTNKGSFKQKGGNQAILKFRNPKNCFQFQNPKNTSKQVESNGGDSLASSNLAHTSFQVSEMGNRSKSPISLIATNRVDNYDFSDPMSSMMGSSNLYSDRTVTKGPGASPPTSKATYFDVSQMSLNQPQNRHQVPNKYPSTTTHSQRVVQGSKMGLGGGLRRAGKSGILHQKPKSGQIEAPELQEYPSGSKTLRGDLNLSRVVEKTSEKKAKFGSLEKAQILEETPLKMILSGSKEGGVVFGVEERAPSNPGDNTTSGKKATNKQLIKPEDQSLDSFRVDLSQKESSRKNSSTKIHPKLVKNPDSSQTQTVTAGTSQRQNLGGGDCQQISFDIRATTHNTLSSNQPLSALTRKQTVSNPLQYSQTDQTQEGSKTSEEGLGLASQPVIKLQVAQNHQKSQKNGKLGKSGLGQNQPILANSEQGKGKNLVSKETQRIVSQFMSRLKPFESSGGRSGNRTQRDRGGLQKMHRTKMPGLMSGGRLKNTSLNRLSLNLSKTQIGQNSSISLKRADLRASGHLLQDKSGPAATSRELRPTADQLEAVDKLSMQRGLQRRPSDKDLAKLAAGCSFLPSMAKEVVMDLRSSKNSASMLRKSLAIASSRQKTTLNRISQDATQKVKNMAPSAHDAVSRQPRPPQFHLALYNGKRKSTVPSKSARSSHHSSTRKRVNISRDTQRSSRNDSRSSLSAAGGKEKFDMVQGFMSHRNIMRGSGLRKNKPPRVQKSGYLSQIIQKKKAELHASNTKDRERIESAKKARSSSKRFGRSVRRGNLPSLRTSPLFKGKPAAKLFNSTLNASKQNSYKDQKAGSRQSSKELRRTKMSDSAASNRAKSFMFSDLRFKLEKSAKFDTSQRLDSVVGRARKNLNFDSCGAGGVDSLTSSRARLGGVRRGLEEGGVGEVTGGGYQEYRKSGVGSSNFFSNVESGGRGKSEDFSGAGGSGSQIWSNLSGRKVMKGYFAVN